MLTLITIFIACQSALADLIYLADLANPGARYPLNDLYDGNATSSFWGQLNSIGLRQQYLLGTYLHQDYIQNQQLIKERYDPHNIQVFASLSTDRSARSASARMYGLFPVGTGWKIPQEVPQDKRIPPYNSSSFNLNDQFALELGFQPIPITNMEDILNDPCPNAGLIKTKKYQEVLKQLSSFQAQHSAFMAKMKLVFNLSALQMTVQTMANLYDTIKSDITLGRTFPSDFTSDDMKELKFMSNYYNSLINSGTYADIFSALILSQVQAKMRDIVNGNSKRKWSMFFMKQMNLIPLVTKLNLTSTDCLNKQWKNQTVDSINCVDVPSFSANMLLELHEDESFNHFIKIKYNGYYVNLCGLKKEECEFEEFWSRASSKNVDYKKECYSK